MAEDQDGAEKSYDPTPRKLKKAREKGEIVRSTDLNTAVVYGGIVLGAALFGPVLSTQIGTLSQVLLGQADTLAPLMLAPGGTALAGGVIGRTMAAFAALIGVPAALLVVALVAQRAILITPSRIAPKLSRISPLQTAKMKYGANGVFEFLKSGTKMLIYAVLLAIFLLGRADQILGSIHAGDGQILALLGRMARDFLIFVFLIALVVGGVDYLWQTAEHLRKNRMTRKEMTDEAKESEGDPHLKQARRQKGVQIAMGQMMQDVPDATVVIVNPTHYAVALKWTRMQGEVPVCVAKGVDAIAHRIREIAAEHAVPVFHDPPTARVLHASVEIGAPVVAEHFRAVAAAIRFADHMREKARKSPLR